jgi:hypothetical protein
MKNLISRDKLLAEKINRHLSALTMIDNDYYSKLSHANILDLKSVLSDINNLLTLKMTVEAAKWLFKYFKIPKANQKLILEKIDRTSPNSSGFDLAISEPLKIVAEVKCINPMREGQRFGSAQRNSILSDFDKLLIGKKKDIPDTSDYLKFLFLIDLGERSMEALKALLIETKIKVKTDLRERRNVVRKQVKILTQENSSSLSKRLVYVKVIKL